MTYVADSSTFRADAFDTYLARLGDVPLLTHAAEKELARRIEEAERAVARALFHCPVSRAALAEIADDLAAGRIKAREITRRPPSLNDGKEERTWLSAFEDVVRQVDVAGGPRRAARAVARKRAERALEELRPTRALLDRVARQLRARLRDDAEPGRPRPDASARASIRATLAAVQRCERAADRARARLVQANLRLVVSVARKYQYRGVHWSDLVQEGNIGLMRAVDKFDYRRGYRFSTYATWWIRQAVTRSVANTAQMIRVPVHMLDAGRRIARTRARLEQVNGIDASVEELAEASGFSAEKVGAALHPWREPVSLETPTGIDGDVPLGDRIEDVRAEDPLESIAAARCARETRALLTVLTPRERDVLKMRFGLDGGEERTLEAIGHVLSLTRERIRQIEVEALRKLRGPLRARRLRAQLDD